jgi:hypothetical protein
MPAWTMMLVRQRRNRERNERQGDDKRRES